jgi:hypothetical protein
MSSYEVETGCVEISDLLQEIARKHGWNVWRGIKQGDPYSYLVMFPDSGRVDWNRASHESCQTLDVPAAVALLKEGLLPQIKIADHTVEFREDGSIKVGCAVIPMKTINAIHARAFDIAQASK